MRKHIRATWAARLSVESQTGRLGNVTQHINYNMSTGTRWATIFGLPLPQNDSCDSIPCRIICVSRNVVNATEWRLVLDGNLNREGYRLTEPNGATRIFIEGYSGKASAW